MQNAPREHSAILSTFIKLPFVVKTFVLSIFCGPFRQVLLYASLSKSSSLNKCLSFTQGYDMHVGMGFCQGR